MAHMGTVHIIDDDEAMRASLSSLLRSMNYTVAQYETASAFLEAALPEGPGCIVLDIRLPGANGLELQEQLSSSRNGLPVVFMTGFGDIPMTVRGMKAGAVDFLTKPFREQDMLDAVASAVALDRRRKRIDAQRQDLETAQASLSPREREVMDLVVKGLMNKQIAGELGLSEVTVKVHRAGAMRKMGAKSVAELARMAEALTGNR